MKIIYKRKVSGRHLILEAIKAIYKLLREKITIPKCYALRFGSSVKIFFLTPSIYHPHTLNRVNACLTKQLLNKAENLRWKRGVEEEIMGERKFFIHFHSIHLCTYTPI